MFCVPTSELPWKKLFCPSILFYSHFQKKHLFNNIEQLVFWASELDSLIDAKTTLLDQFIRLDIEINSKGFFSIYRSFLGNVGSIYPEIFIRILSYYFRYLTDGDERLHVRCAFLAV